MPDDGTVPSTPTQDLEVIARVFDDTNVIMHGVDGVIMHWTSGCERLYGWKCNDAVGRVVHKLRTKYPRPIPIEKQGAWRARCLIKSFEWPPQRRPRCSLTVEEGPPHHRV
jgi:hypothetical protein